VHSFIISENDGKCPFCNSDRASKIDEEKIEEIMKRVEANDAASIYVLANHYEHGGLGLQQNYTKAKEFYARSADLGFNTEWRWRIVKAVGVVIIHYSITPFFRSSIHHSSILPLLSFFSWKHRIEI
jgi:hypothetical protein